MNDDRLTKSLNPAEPEYNRLTLPKGMRTADFNDVQDQANEEISRFIPLWGYKRRGPRE